MFRICLRCLSTAVLACLAQPAAATVFTVTSTGNSGAGTLRQAVLDANADATATVATPHRIEFGIAGTGVKTITLSSALNALARPTIVDGTTQTGYTGSQPMVRLTFTLPGANTNGLVFSGSGSVARALTIVNFGTNAAGVLFNAVNNGAVNDCWLGVESDGSTAAGGAAGVRFTNAVSCSVTRCVLSGNTVGADFAGTTNKCTLSGCLLGFGADLSATGNTSAGLRIAATSFDNTIGTSGTGRNFIAHNTTAGIDCDGDNCTFENNFIGMLPGDYNLSGQTWGIRLGASSNSCTVGSTTAGLANHLANHDPGAGLQILGSGTVVRGNRFGLGPGNAVRANFYDVFITDTASASDISENTMAGSRDSVVVEQSAAGSPLGHGIRRNSIRTGKLGINLRPTGEAISTVTPNDAGDGDGGPNNLMNFPVITSVQKPAADTVVTGTLNSGTGFAAGTQVIIDVYRSSADQRTGHVWGGSTTVVLSGAATVTWSVTVPGAWPGEWFTATAMVNSAGKTDTSEFSAAMQAAPGTVLFNPATQLIIAEGGPAATAPLVRTGGTYGSITANIVFTPGTAVPGTDTVQTSAAIDFPDGSDSPVPSLTVTSVNDTLHEDTEALSLTIASVTGGASAGSVALAVSITDNDAPPAVRISGVPAAVVEGGAQTFTISLTPASGVAASVTYVTEAISAVAGADFTAAAGTVNFAPGETSKTVTITTLDDALDESPETYRLRIGSPVRCTLGTPSAAAATINDDTDPPPSLVASAPVFAVEGDNTGHDLVFKVRLSTASGNDTKVRVVAQSGTAVSAVDFESLDESLAIPAGQISVDLPVKLKPSAGTEPDESLSLLIQPLDGIAAGDVTLAGTIMQEGIRAFSLTGGTASITCPVTTGRTWKLQSSTNLAPPWVPVTEDINSPGGLRTFNAPAPLPRAFYRVISSP